MLLLGLISAQAVRKPASSSQANRVLSRGEARATLQLSACAQNLRSFVGMLLGGVMSCIGPALIVEVVQQRGRAPQLLICAQFAGVGSHASLHRERVFAKAFTLRVLAQQAPGFFPIRHFSPF